MLISVGRDAFYDCRSLTCVSLPHTLINFGTGAFEDCERLISVSFRPPVDRACFIVWSVGNMRNRVNWQLTTVKHLRNVLRLITEFGLETRDVDEATVDPDGNNRAFGEIDYPQPDEYMIDHIMNTNI